MKASGIWHIAGKQAIGYFKVLPVTTKVWGLPLEKCRLLTARISLSKIHNKHQNISYSLMTKVINYLKGKVT